MTVESELARIANALEAIAAKAPIVNPNPPKAMPVAEMFTAPSVAPSAPTRIPAVEIVRPVDPPAAPKRGPGRPAKSRAPDPAPEPAAAPAADPLDFLTDGEPDAPPATVEDVRAALVSLQKRSGNPEKARKVLKEAGDGAETLKSLKAEFYGAVIAAASAA